VSAARATLSRALKELERRWRRAFMGGLVRLLPRRRAPLPDWRARPHRVLYLRYDRIGDMILTTGVLRAIKRAQPNVELDVLASPSNATILEGNPHVSCVLVFERRDWRRYLALLRRLRRGRYDAVVDGMVLDPSVTALLLMLAAGAPYRIGVGGRRNDAAYTVPVPAAAPDAQAVLQSAVLATPFGIDPASADLLPEIPLRDGEREAAESAWRSLGAGPRLVVNVSATGADRQWPQEHFVAALRTLREHDPALRVLVVGAPWDAERLAFIARETAEATRLPGLRGTLALVATADAVLTPDTSIAHAASAFRKPAVVLFTLGKALYEPYGIPAINLVSGSETLAALPPGEVAQAVARLMRATVGMRD
jgi:ADP-heptose:LPS heptosyltransferase